MKGASEVSKSSNGGRLEVERVGFVGIGTMGAAIARHPARAGYPMTVWNRTPDRAGEPVTLDATEGATPAHVAGASEVT